VIRYVGGDLFASPAQSLVNTVNTVGVMGKGIALTFKKLFPDMFTEYQQLCEKGELRIGTLHVYPAPNKLIVNFPTKTTWKQPSHPTYIEAGLRTFVQSYEQMGITSAAFPPLGCGNGELDFERQVRPLMERYLDPIPLPVFIYPPQSKSELAEHRSIRTMKTWLHSDPEAMPFSEFWDDVQVVVSNRKQFRTLAKGAQFEAEIVPQSRDIRLRIGGRSHLFREEELQEIWREMRYHLVAVPQSLPQREKEAAYVLAILSHIPYVETIELARSPGDLHGNPQHGVRLIPRAHHQPELGLALTS
jgi:O-acetyl-ADP-ribose deacetylase (regulator of RNase III)